MLMSRPQKVAHLKWVFYYKPLEAVSIKCKDRVFKFGPKTSSTSAKSCQQMIHFENISRKGEYWDNIHFYVFLIQHLGLTKMSGLHVTNVVHLFS